MPKKLTIADADATAAIGHNSDHHRVIKEVADTVIRLKAERAEIQAQITEAKGRLRSLGIKMTDFNVALRLYELETEDRNDSIDSIKIAFEALGLGHQGDLFPEVAGHA